MSDELYLPQSHYQQLLKAQLEVAAAEFAKASYGPDTGSSVILGPAGGLDRLIRERGGEQRHADKALYYSLYTKHPFVYACVELIVQTAAQDRHTYPSSDNPHSAKKGQPTEYNYAAAPRTTPGHAVNRAVKKAHEDIDSDDDLEAGPNTSPKTDGIEFLEAFFGEVNPFESFQDLLSGIYRDLLVSGEAYILKQRQGATVKNLFDDGSVDSEEVGAGRHSKVVSDPEATVVALYRIPSRDTWAVPGKDGYPMAYRQRSEGGGYREYAKEDVVFIRLPDPNDPCHGFSPLEALDLSLATDMQAARYNEAYFRNGAKAGMVFSAQGLAEHEIRRNREWINTEYVRPEFAHRPMMLLGNISLVRDGNKAQNDMEFLKLRQFTREEVAAVYSVPLSKLLMESNTLGQAGKMSDDVTFRADTVGPLQTKVYEAVNRQMMKPDFPQHPMLIAPRQEKIRLDLLEAAKSLVMCGGTGNEARAVLHLPIIANDENMDQPLFLIPSVAKLTEDVTGAPDEAGSGSAGPTDAQRPDKTSRRTSAGQTAARVKRGVGMKTRG